MKKLDMIYEGKAKKVYQTDNPEMVVVDYKDDATAFNGLKKGTILGKGVINNKISNHLFKILELQGIPTHFVEEISGNETLVKKVEIIPIEVIVRNIAAGGLSKRLGITEGTKLTSTIIEFSYKNDALGDPMINDYHVAAMNLAGKEELSQIVSFSMRINTILSKYFLELHIKLVDFKLEFGRCNGAIILADEISPDTCRFWDAETDEKLDKDRFRRDLGNVEEAYHEISRRMGI